MRVSTVAGVLDGVDVRGSGGYVVFYGWEIRVGYGSSGVSTGLASCELISKGIQGNIYRSFGGARSTQAWESESEFR